LKTRVILVDTDAGVDDILALFVLLQTASSSIDAAVTFGNVSLYQAISNVSLFSHISGLAPRKILSGSLGPLVGRPHFAIGVHGDDGLGGITSLPSWRPPMLKPSVLPFVGTQLSQYSTIITLGPMTNVAKMDYDSVNPPPLFVMGGAFAAKGNVTSSSEFNFYSDPDAASFVFEHYAGEIFVVPLDVCNTIVLGRKYLRYLCGARPSQTLTFLNLIHQHYMDFYLRAEGIDGCHPHDALAVCAAMIPDSFVWKQGRVHVLSDGPERGRSLFETNATGRHHLAQSVDAARFFKLLESAVSNFKDLRD
jgi:inosine-uridine nucleoside N-ribohydrolase